MPDNKVDAPGSDGVRRALAAALADVDALGLSGPDREVVLRSAIDARLAAETDAVTVEVGGCGPNGGSSSNRGPDRGSDALSQIASAMHVERASVELVYDIRDGEPQLVVSGRRFPENKSVAIRMLAQLVAGARQATGLEAWTSSSDIRAVVTDYGRMDTNNFATHLQSLDGIALFRGRGPSREIKITKPGMESVGELVSQLATGSVA